MYFDNYHPSTVCSPNSLCPRLLEYIRKKESYDDINIKPRVSLEQEFQISRHDLKIINKYYKNQKINQSHGWSNNTSYLQQPSINSANLLDEQFQGGFLEDTIQDPKFDELFQKSKKDKARRNKQRTAARRQTCDDFIIHDYEDTTCYDRHMQDTGNAGYYNKYEQNTYNKIPNINYHNMIPNSQSLDQNKYEQYNKKHNNSINKIIGEYDEYGKQITPLFEQQGEMDTQYKMNFPSCSSKGKKNIDSSKYKAMPYMGWGDQVRDIETENNLVRCMSDSKAKSFGHDNLFEHNFDYISDDIQNPDHVVLPFPRGGEDTRRWNKESAQPQYRDIY
jgi:hypothetical protein